ncbi:autophagy protein 5-like isoform X1 [Xenia sp. Carnegie-2017]|uniref:autophagy protein 5-like isoform X1 n=1 Tax=Xenia sp. Carnegie-2017 TaxID=2897299 RepID=UPI001F047DA1|nr:autophagy protein 5-like isoform X1 [Xenia sp. Carnegie-2017]
MADDREVLRILWDGRIPVCFSLNSDEVFTLEQPEPFYLLLPRVSYLPVVTDKVTKHFQSAIKPDKDTSSIWFDFNGQSLKWHYPIGVLFDLYGSHDALPWNITVHFEDFPEDELIHCESKEVVESYFMSAIKEADSLKHKSQIINSMQKKDHKQLWLGLNNDKFEQFWGVNKRLMERSGDELFRHIPFRIHQGDEMFIQKLVKPINEAGELLTLKSLMQQALPDTFATNEDFESAKIVIHGIEPPTDTPLQWLSEHFSYPDNFLHIVLSKNVET